MLLEKNKGLQGWAGAEPSEEGYLRHVSGDVIKPEWAFGARTFQEENSRRRSLQAGVDVFPDP